MLVIQAANNFNVITGELLIKNWSSTGLCYFKYKFQVQI